MSQPDSTVAGIALHETATIHIPNELFVNIEKFDATVDDTHLNIKLDTGHNWRGAQQTTTYKIPLESVDSLVSVLLTRLFKPAITDDIISVTAQNYPAEVKRNINESDQ